MHMGMKTNQSFSSSKGDGENNSWQEAPGVPYIKKEGG